MKFTLSWLKDHLETTASVGEIAEALTDLGLEVEGVEDRAARLKDFTLGKVLAAEKHPDADKLSVCRVLTEDGEVQIVCGAPNAREGITVVVARPGTYIPGIDTTIQVGKIRGVESHGMMCSEREMELSDAHEGIIELPSGAVGERFTNWLAAHDPARVDPVIEIAITPNRADALGVHGIARDLAARGLGRLIERPVEPVPGSFPCPVPVSIDADTQAACPVFFGRLIRGVTNGPSPDWLQARLRAIGLRPISFLVDVTNFFTYDMNRPLHVFDADRIRGGLRVHGAEGGESLVGLDDKTYGFEPGMTLISDAEEVESIAGVMGGARTGVTAETVNVFVEAAYFDPIRTAQTGRALKINSDARYRFERGIDPEWTPHGLEAATRMILEIAGGEASEVVQAGTIPDHARAFRLDPQRVVRLVGMEISEAEQRQTLAALGFRMAGDQAHVPSWRPDVQGEADLVEEVARVASLTRLEGIPMARAQAGVPKPILTPIQRREGAARRRLAALGYNECVTYSFIDAGAATAFGAGEAVRLENPISSEMTHLRPDLLPGLLQVAARNQARGLADLALFEVGPVFSGGEPGEQALVAAGLLVGASGPRSPQGGRRPVDVYDAKADMEAVLAAIGAPEKRMILRDVPAWFHPGRSGRAGLGPQKTIAVFGELHPKILRAFDVKGPAVAFAVFPEAVPLPRAGSSARPALILNDLQAVERDFAFVVDAGVAALDLVNAAAGADKALIESVSVFDEFAGPAAEAQMGTGMKSLAISVRLQPTEKTLTEKEIEAVAARIVEKVGKATGGSLRG
ncbi:MAG: phenylalanine--tRNA ligase subunit beta [Rhodobacteraceae bacterium]|nr:phenylalanine--tRNA ligase subunit beta [Paracoccaceae bacterium]